MSRLVFILLALAAVVSVPFALKPEFDHDPRRATDPSQILNIITPNSESIRREFTTAFRKHMRETEGRDVFIEWRVPGGTSEIERILDTEYTFAFRNHWEKQLGRSWSSEIETGFNNRKLNLPEDPAKDSPVQAARRAFLASDVGVRIDLFFSGGSYPFVVNAAKGYLVTSDVPSKHPEWFSEEIFPAVVSGEPFYDKEHRWLGSCLTTFGLCYNRDVLERLEVDPGSSPGWALLAEPALYKEVALADPTVSGSVTKAFEMIMQQQMRQAWEAAGQSEDALAEGWAAGLNLIRRIGANARYYATFSPKIPADVAGGNAAAGLCIDYYGRTYNELLRGAHGESRIVFVTPLGGSSTSVDPIALLRGAPNPELANKFLEFLFSKKGQQLWNYRAGTEGGPVRQALRRLPVRKDLYTTDHLQHFADPNVMPYENTHLFTYEPDWTARAFGAIRFIIKAMCLDSHHELQEAWEALIENDFPPEAVATFNDLAPVTYEMALGEISDQLRLGKVEQTALARELNAFFRERYGEVVKIAGR